VDDPSRPFHPVIKDEEFRAALTAAITPGEPRSAKEILADIYQGRVSPQESECVMRLSTDELYELFKGLKGEELYPVIEGSLFYRRVGNATDEQTEFTQRSLAALEKIGKESELNAIRVQKFGVIMDANKSQLE
jgi:hypothetical protein